MRHRRQCLLGLDGLAWADFQSLLAHFPKSRKYFRALENIDFESNCFTTAQPVWAEILTGKPWYQNGCVGYAQPQTSLNKLVAFSEKNLSVEASLIRPKEGSKAIIINTPILVPDTATRIWLSDGSLPLNKLVSPRTLLETKPFSEYKPRPYVDIGSALVSTRESLENIINIEALRIEAALALLKTDWSTFICRFTAFDHLAHILGKDFLETNDLEIFPLLNSLMESLDEFFQYVLSLADVEIFILSAFSHQACRSTLNLNRVLQEAKFLSAKPSIFSEEEDTHRRAAVSLVRNVGSRKNLSSSYEGRIVTVQTVAASPVSGCVYINSKGKFADGLVEKTAYQETRAVVSSYLNNTLTRHYGARVTVRQNPVADLFDVALPEFVVRIDGVEFDNMYENGMRDYDLPRTTHCSKGFVMMPSAIAKSTKIEPWQIKDLMYAR